MKKLQHPVMALCLAMVVTSGISAQQPTPQPQKAVDAAAPARPFPGTQNVRIEVTITDQRDGAPSAPKIISMILTDRDPGRMRSGTGRNDGMLNVDVRPEVTRENRVKMSLTLEYRPPMTGEKEMVPLTQSLTMLLDDGKPLTVSQSADPGSNRSVKVEVKATMLK